MDRRVLAFALCTTLSAGAWAALAATSAGCARAASAADKTHDGVGTIQSIGPNGAFAMISHDDIPGYMPAMTMQFTAGVKDQLAGLAPGDRVAFSFTEKFVLTSIRKR